MNSILPIGIRAVIEPSDPLYRHYVKHAQRKQEYTHCDYCGGELSEDGMSYRGVLIASHKTCRNPDCPMFDWSHAPDEHRAQCRKKKANRND